MPEYGIVAIATGAIFLQKAYALRQCPSDRDRARSTFKYSIFYMMILSAGMVIDSLPMTRRGIDLAIGFATTWIQGVA